MKFKINKDHFSSGLQQVMNVVATRSATPILNNVLIEAKDGHIALTTTNLDIGISCRIKSETEVTGAITLPVRKLATIVGNYQYAIFWSNWETVIKSRLNPGDQTLR